MDILLIWECVRETPFRARLVEVRGTVWSQFNVYVTDL